MAKYIRLCFTAKDMPYAISWAIKIKMPDISMREYVQITKGCTFNGNCRFTGTAYLMGYQIDAYKYNVALLKRDIKKYGIPKT